MNTTIKYAFDKNGIVTCVESPQAKPMSEIEVLIDKLVAFTDYAQANETDRVMKVLSLRDVQVLLDALLGLDRKAK